MDQDKEQRRIEIEEQVKQLWGEQSIHLEELVHMNDEARSEALEKVLASGGSKVTERPDGSEDYLVFIDRDYDLDYVTDFSLGRDRNTLISEVVAAGSLPTKHLPKDEHLAYKRILAGALTCAIESSPEKARAQLEAGKDYLKKRTAERSRIWILLSTLPIMAILAMIGYSKQELFDMDEVTLAPWLISIYFALLASFFSMVLRSGRGEMDSASGPGLHALEVGIRFISGAVAGLTIAFIANSPLCPEVFEGIVDASGGPQTLGFIAGFSDKWIRSFISKYELEK